MKEQSNTAPADDGDEWWIELARQVCRNVRCDADLRELPLLLELEPNVAIVRKVGTEERR